MEHAITLAGDDQVERWRAKAAAYPDGLQRAMLEENLRFGRFGHAAEMLAARDDVLALYGFDAAPYRRDLTRRRAAYETPPVPPPSRARGSS